MLSTLHSSSLKITNPDLGNPNQAVYLAILENVELAAMKSGLINQLDFEAQKNRSLMQKDQLRKQNPERRGECGNGGVGGSRRPVVFP